MGCISTFFDHISNCTDFLKVNALLEPGISYEYVITDKFNREYSGVVIADAEGFLSIPVTDLPAGFFTPWSGSYKMQIFSSEAHCGALPLKLAEVYDSITFEVKGGTRVKENLGCDYNCIPGSAAMNAIFPFTNSANVHVDWTSLLQSLYGNAPSVTVYHEISPNVYQLANVTIQLNGGPYDLQSIDIDNGGSATGYILIHG